MVHKTNSFFPNGAPYVPIAVNQLGCTSLGEQLAERVPIAVNRLNCTMLSDQLVELKHSDCGHLARLYNL